MRGADSTVRRNSPPSVRLGTKQLRIQVLLDRAHFSPGEIDGLAGRVSRIALQDFQKSHRPLDDDPSVPTLIEYTITDDDVRGPFVKIPADLMDQANLPALGYQSPIEAIGEKFHASPKLLTRLNPGKDFSKSGEVIRVPNVRSEDSHPGKAASVVVSKSRLTVQALDESGKILADYPATVGSVHDPLPIGAWKVKGIRRNPVFYYNPNLFWDAPGADTKAEIPPGPNNPVGVVWIGLTKEHYGIHGTPEPSLIGHVQSHGCIRLTNWDAAELARMVAAGTPVVCKE
jgi:lipoprotein-anchoring transpeptidase ErfK/SrfK